MNHYALLWAGTAWSLYMLTVLIGYAVWGIGKKLWRWKRR